MKTANAGRSRRHKYFNKSMWTKQTVEEKLKKNPFFEHFLDEGVGTYACVYVINNIQVIIYFTVSATIDVYMSSKPQSKEDAFEIQCFAKLAKEICEEMLKKGGKK